MLQKKTCLQIQCLPFCCSPGAYCPSVSSIASVIRSCNICCSFSASSGVWDVDRLGNSAYQNIHRNWVCMSSKALQSWDRVMQVAAADLSSLCRAAVLGHWFCRGLQISIAGYILDKVHEGSTGVGACSDVNDITGTAKLKSGLRLSPERQWKCLLWFLRVFWDF